MPQEPPSPRARAGGRLVGCGMRPAFTASMLLVVGLTSCAPAPPPAPPAAVPFAGAPAAPPSGLDGQTPAPAAAPDAPLYFVVDAGTLRLSPTGEKLTPEVVAALAPTQIVQAVESVEVAEPSYSIHITTAGALDVAALSSDRPRSPAIGGIMYDPLHIDITFADPAAAAPAATALWNACDADLPEIDVLAGLHSARRSLESGTETLTLRIDEPSAAASTVEWARAQGHRVATTPPEALPAPPSSRWSIIVFDGGPRGVVIHCARRAAASPGH